MTFSDLTQTEQDELRSTIRDLSIIFDRDRIPIEDVPELIDSFESERVARYLRHLQYNSKPEAALREELIAGGSPLSKFFFGDDVSPEVNTSDGFIDYQIHEDVPILLELKPPFIPVYDDGNLTHLKNQNLNLGLHEDQIEKYQKDNEYLIFTNLQSWHFFSRYSGFGEPIRSDPIGIDEFYGEFGRESSLSQYLDRLYQTSVKGELDEAFFEALKRWVADLEELEFSEDISEDDQTEEIINVINKFIFIQTLDSYSVVDFNWIADSWNDNERKWSSFSTRKFLEEFLDEITYWFHTYYDTELFEGTILDDLVDSEENIEQLYSCLKTILGLEDWQQMGAAPGITNFNFREIDEDVFGKAYETFLAEIRREQGIYYTPKHITEYIVSETVGDRFSDIADEAIHAVEESRFEEAKEAVEQLKTISVVDPACGSGSFLIKALRQIWKEYQRVISVLDEKAEEHAELVPGTLERSEEDKEAYSNINEILSVIDPGDDRDLVSKIILRHLHGNDLDHRALDVAKLNIWLEAIKLAPDSFYYQRIPEGEGYVLPDLEWNMGHGDSLVGMPIDDTVQYLSENHSDAVSQLSELRNRYLDNPRDEDAIVEGRRVLSDLRGELDTAYAEHLDDQNIDRDPFQNTIPSYWGLQFWHIFDNSDPGFDIVIGNPPYIGEKERKERFDLLEETSIVNECYRGRMDMLYFFVLLGIRIGDSSSVSSMITTAYWPEADSAKSLRKEIVNQVSVDEIIAFDGHTVFDQAPGQENLIYQFDHSPVSQTTFSYIQSGSFTSSDVAESLLSDKEIFHQSSYDEDEFEFPADGSEWYGIGGLARDSFELPDTTTVLDDYFDSKQGAIPSPDTVTKRSYDDYNNPDLEVGEGVFLLDSDDLSRIGISSDHALLKPAYRNSDISRCHVDYPDDLFLLYITSDDQIEQYPLIHQHLQRYQDKLEDRREVEQDKIEWYSLQWPRSPDLFETPKIVYPNWGNDWQPYAVEDQGRYERRDITLLKPDDEDTDLYKFVALLNSCVTEYWQTEKRARTGYTTQGSLEDLPVPDDLPDDAGDVAREMSSLKSARSVLEELFDDVSGSLARSEQNLWKILDDDRQIIGKSPENAWTTSVDFYPDDDNEASDSLFDSFTVRGDRDNCSISIFAVNDQIEDQIYQLECDDERLLELIYRSLVDLQDSNKTVESLDDIFEKTSVPVIPEGPRTESANIISEVQRRFEQDDCTDQYDVAASRIAVDNLISETQSEIDAQVLGAYDLDKTDSKLILDSIGASSDRMEYVLDSSLL